MSALFNILRKCSSFCAYTICSGFGVTMVRGDRVLLFKCELICSNNTFFGSVETATPRRICFILFISNNGLEVFCVIFLNELQKCRNRRMAEVLPDCTSLEKSRNLHKPCLSLSTFLDKQESRNNLFPRYRPFIEFNVFQCDTSSAHYTEQRIFGNMAGNSGSFGHQRVKIAK